MPPQPNVKKNKIAKSGAIGILAVIGSSFAAIIFIPPIISQIGEQSYGVWASLAIFTGAGALFDLGIPRSMTYYLGASKKTNNHGSKIFWTSAAIIALIATLISTTLLIAEIYFHGNSFSWSDIPKEIVAPLIACGIYLAIASIITNFLRAHIEYSLRSHVLQIFALIFHLLNFGGVFLITIVSKNTMHLILHTCIATTAIMLLHLVYCIKFLAIPKYTKPDKRIAKILLGRSLGHFSLSIINSLSLPINRYLAITLGGTNAHTVFDVTARVAIAATGMLQAFNLQIFGIALKLRLTHSTSALRLAKRMTGITFTLYALGIIILFFTADSISEYLLQNTKEEASTILFIMVAGVATTGVAEPAMRTMWAWGLERTAASIRGFALIVNFTLIALLAGKNPTLAISIGYSASLILGSIATIATLFIIEKKNDRF